jgi:genome maintenance exonuclease 1
MIWNKKFIYPPSTRSLIENQRHYEIGTAKLPSVTTILEATQTDEKKKSLENWRKKVGENKADMIRDTAATRGTIMHRILEGYLTGHRHSDLSDLGQQAGVMATNIWETDLRDNMQEVWGSEIVVYYPELYAGASDLVGIYAGRESIIDFKQSNRLKRREWVVDYFLQLAGYALAHNVMHGTKIQCGVILMCTADNMFQKFVVKEEEFQRYMWGWLRRVSEFYGKLTH